MENVLKPLCPAAHDSALASAVCLLNLRYSVCRLRLAEKIFAGLFTD